MRCCKKEHLSAKRLSAKPLNHVSINSRTLSPQCSVWRARILDFDGKAWLALVPSRDWREYSLCCGRLLGIRASLSWFSPESFPPQIIDLVPIKSTPITIHMTIWWQIQSYWERQTYLQKQSSCHKWFTIKPLCYSSLRDVQPLQHGASLNLRNESHWSFPSMAIPDRTYTKIWWQTQSIEGARLIFRSNFIGLQILKGRLFCSSIPLGVQSLQHGSSLEAFQRKPLAFSSAKPTTDLIHRVKAYLQKHF